LFSLPPKEQQAPDWYVVSVSRGGMIKKTALEELPGPSARTFQLVKINDGDRLGWIRTSDGISDLLLASASGMTIRFKEAEVRPMGLVAAGVMGIKLKVGDEVVGFEVIPDQGEVYLQRSDGHAKRIALKQFPRQGRYGQGVIAWKAPAGTRLVGMAIGKGTTRVIVHLLKLSAKAVRMDNAPIRTRPSRGKSVVGLRAGDQVLAISVPLDPPRPIQKKTSRKKRPSKKQLSMDL
jgi:DNA gyrase subunit A